MAGKGLRENIFLSGKVTVSYFFRRKFRAPFNVIFPGKYAIKWLFLRELAAPNWNRNAKANAEKPGGSVSFVTA
jgi:hypothetical protein